MGKVFRETEVVEGMDGAVQATIVGNGTSLIEVDVGMVAQFVERELVDIQLARRRVLDDQIILGTEREILDFIELIDADIASQTLSILYNLPGEIRSDTRNGLQLRRVSRIQIDMLSLSDLRLIVCLDGVMFHIWQSPAPLIGRVTIDDLRTDIDSPIPIWLSTETVAMMLTRGLIPDGIGRNEGIRRVIFPSCQEND